MVRAVAVPEAPAHTRWTLPAPSGESRPTCRAAAWSRRAPWPRRGRLAGRCRAAGRSWLLHFRPGDEIRDAIQLGVGQSGSLAAQQRGDGVLRRPVEEGIDKVLEGRLA